ncbi:unnamed protein product [Orchesella dallaii]|uniref:Uncharacterized protein n=1 Tax=Orchesella dallaii TaxID=48710 RepID=A0ABP1RIP5_9HEXA
MCVPTYTPSQEITNVAFTQLGCMTIAMPSTTITPPKSPILTCSEQTSCEACVDPDLQFKDGNGKCVWEVTSVGQNCFSQSYYIPSQEIYKIAYNQEGCSTLSSTTTTKAPTPERDPCLAENTCESCVGIATSQGLENLSTCLWVATPSNGHCASTFTPSQEIDKIAFTLNGCATSPPPPTCEQQETCEACVRTRIEPDRTGLVKNCVWKITKNGQLCVANYTRSPEIANIFFNEVECKNYQKLVPNTISMEFNLIKLGFII